ncbi:hypothetical protein P3T76_016041 [Phytophthora citrophthora]|uniref:MULE transposase domain-containing protein n=1 Tax=Phytophthora citrophthora TaxID=4793 RepID=A0AAD9L9R0_9STRA|nr:hypothetical protein P3T76_016041 [Phytophthora citrophthora]
MRSNRSPSSGSVWSNRDGGQADDSLDEESDDRLVEGDDNFDAENDRHQAEDREDKDNSRLPFYHSGEFTTSCRCSAYRRTGCFVKLNVSRRGFAVEGRHKSDCVPELVQAPDGSAPVVENRKQQMLLATDEVGIQDFGKLFMIGLTATKRRCPRSDQKTDFRPIVQNKKQTFWAGDFRAFGNRSLCDVKNNPGLKNFQFHLAYNEGDVLHRRQSSLFIDATYCCVPIRYYQLVIIMMHDPISDLYLPIWYALTSGKTTRVYELLFNCICVATKNRLDPVHVVCDFEYAVIKTVKDQFPNSRIVRCLFHFKQSVRLEMLKLNISEAEVRCIDRLTVIRRCDTVLRGIQDVRHMIKRDCGDQGIAYSKENWKNSGNISSAHGSRNLCRSGGMSMG